jgi:hypothetical protein
MINIIEGITPKTWHIFANDSHFNKNTLEYMLIFPLSDSFSH